MVVMDIRCRIINDGHGKYSFQCYNNVTGNVFFSPAQWWDSEEEVKKVCDTMQDTVYKNLATTSGIKKDAEGHIQIDMPEADVAALAHNINGGGNIVGVALAVHRTTGQFGYCVIDTNDKVLLPPKQYYTTQQEAINAAKANQAAIIAELKEKGLGEYQFQMDNLSPEVTTAQLFTQPAYNESAATKKSTAYPFGIKPTKDPSLN